MTKTVLILGSSGKIGVHSARAFSDAGWNVRKFNRSTDDLMAAAQGADVIVNGFNPPNYHDWQNIIPTFTADVIRAAKHSGSTVIIPGNVYHFGDTPGVWSEQTVPNPVSRKGRIRLEMEQAYKASGVRTIVLRAGNFIDPNRDGCVMSMIYLRSIQKGKITLPGPAETRQAMCYLPDWARAAVALAEKRTELATFEDIPFPGNAFSADDIKQGLERILGRPLKYTRFPWPVFTLLSPVWEMARELSEMRYLWTTDHALSGEKFGRILPEFTPTDVDTVLTAALPNNLRVQGSDVRATSIAVRT